MNSDILYEVSFAIEFQAKELRSVNLNKIQENTKLLKEVKTTVKDLVASVQR